MKHIVVVCNPQEGQQTGRHHKQVRGVNSIVGPLFENDWLSWQIVMTRSKSLLVLRRSALFKVGEKSLKIFHQGDHQHDHYHKQWTWTMSSNGILGRDEHCHHNEHYHHCKLYNKFFRANVVVVVDDKGQDGDNHHHHQPYEHEHYHHYHDQHHEHC